jgi:uncharacterized protein (DUF58 family)
MAISGRLVALAALGVLPAIAGGWLLWLYLLLLVLAVSADLLLAAPVTALELQREPSAPVRLGETAATELRLTNLGRRVARGLLRDAWVPSAGARPREHELRIGPGERRSVRTELVPTRRGERRTAQVSVRSFGPLGLAARQRRLAVAGQLRVLPAFTSRRFLPEKLSRLRQLDGSVLVRQRGQGSEFDSLREYVPGDDVRAIDWRASARAVDVMVRTWRPERDRHIVLAIDTGRTSAARIGDEPRLDAALDAGLLLAAVATRAGDRVALVAADVVVRARLGLSGGGDVLPKLVTAMTPLQPALVETDPQLLAAEVLRSVSGRSLIVLFSSLDAASAESGLLPAARMLVSRHRLVVASVGDPRLAELAAGRDDSAAVYTAAAAELAAAERREVSSQLRRLGAVVVDAPAGTFASAVTDSYLDLKAAGLL